MYADRQGAQLLAEFEPPSPEALIMRYNVAQIQGVLYSAQNLTVDLGAEADARLVFHYVKLLDLIYNLEPIARGYRLRLDGPLSLFGSTRKYGLRLAKLIPGLLLTGSWQLHASVSWKGRDVILELDSETPGLASHYKGPADAGEGDVREAFAKAWSRAKEKDGWELASGTGILPIPQLKTALVPDFTLRNAKTGEKVHLEILASGPTAPRGAGRAPTGSRTTRIPGPHRRSRVSRRFTRDPLYRDAGGHHPLQEPPGREIRPRGAADARYGRCCKRINKDTTELRGQLERRSGGAAHISRSPLSG
jgi:hypothetical protein